MLVVPPGSGIVHQVRHLFHQSVNTVGISCFAMFPPKNVDCLAAIKANELCQFEKCKFLFCAVYMYSYADV